jgi:hypothetical protein
MSSTFIHSKRRHTRICIVCSSGSPWEALRKGLEDMLTIPYKRKKRYWLKENEMRIVSRHPKQQPSKKEK